MLARIVGSQRDRSRLVSFRCALNFNKECLDSRTPPLESACVPHSRAQRRRLDDDGNEYLEFQHPPWTPGRIPVIAALAQKHLLTLPCLRVDRQTGNMATDSSHRAMLEICEPVIISLTKQVPLPPLRTGQYPQSLTRSKVYSYWFSTTMLSFIILQNKLMQYSTPSYTQKSHLLLLADHTLLPDP